MYSSNAFSNPHLSHNIVNDKNGSISRHMTYLSKQWWLFRELANIDFRSNQMRLRNFDDDYNINGHVNKVNRKTSSMKHQRNITAIRMRAMCVLFPSFVITTAVCKFGSRWWFNENDIMTRFSVKTMDFMCIRFMWFFTSFTNSTRSLNN